MYTLLIVLTIFVGMLMPVQAGVNAQLRQHVGHPLWAGLTNFLVGLVALALVAALSRLPSPLTNRTLAAPWWSWLGGLMGASLVVQSLVAAPRLGATLLVACLICGQLTASLVVDHFGWGAYAVKAITPARIVGVMLLVAGVALIQSQR